MKLNCPAFLENQKIPPIYTCDGENINPPLLISEVPNNAQSLALITDDPDAPNGTFTHWMIWNMLTDLKEISENNVPEGAEQGMNGRGKMGYTGPCPPSGVHHYHFKLFALNRKLDVSINISKQELEREIQGSLIEKAELIGIYNRST